MQSCRLVTRHGIQVEMQLKSKLTTQSNDASRAHRHTHIKQVHGAYVKHWHVCKRTHLKLTRGVKNERFIIMD